VGEEERDLHPGGEKPREKEGATGEGKRGSVSEKDTSGKINYFFGDTSFH